MALPHIELLDTFAVWRDYFNFVVDEFNTASALPSANTLVRRDANGAIAVTTLSFVGTGVETLENKVIDAANNTLILSLNDLQDVTVSSTPNNNQILRYNTTSGNWIVANETVYTEYTDSDVDTHLNKNSASNNQILSWTGSDYAWITQTALYSNSDVDTHLNTSAASTNQILSWNGSDYDWITQTPLYSDSDVGQYLNLNSASSNQILSWTGSNFSWVSQTPQYNDSDVDTHLNRNSASANQVLSWSGSDYSWITQTPLYSDSDVDTHLNRNSASANQVLSWSGSDYNWIDPVTAAGGTSYTNADADAHLNVSTASANQVLTWTGADYNWTNKGLLSVSDDTSPILGNNLNVDQYDLQNVDLMISADGGDISFLSKSGGTETQRLSVTQNGITVSGTFNNHTIPGGIGTLALTSDIPTPYTNTDLDTYLNVSTASANQVLTWTGTNYNWTTSLSSEVDTLDSVMSRGATTSITAVIPFLYSDQNSFPEATSSHGALAHSHQDGAMFFAHSGMWIQLANINDMSSVSRNTANGTTSSIANDVASNLNITSMCKSYHLLKIETDAAAWVTLYTDATSRTNDASRNILTDPTPGSGVIAEAITTSAGTVNFTPAIVGWNNDSTPTTTIYAKVVNKSGSTRTITTTLTIIPIET